VQIVAERSTFDEDPATFRAKYDDRQSALTGKIVEARQRLKQVRMRARGVCLGAGCGVAV
jgi:magnesium chelatase subunit I